MKYIARRFLTLAVTMLIVSFLAFASFSMISGSVAEIMLGTQGTPEKVEALKEELGLNRPMLIRYAEWLKGFFTGDLGTSYSYHQPVGTLISEKVVVTLFLSGLTFLFIIVISIPIGLLSARYSEGIFDGFHTALNQLCMAVPSFLTGILLSWVFGIVLKWFMPGAFPGLEHLGASIKFLCFAAISLAIPRIAMTVRMLRGTILTEMQKDYVRTAISRGNGRSEVLWRHVLRNSLVPVITFLSQIMAEILAGSIIIEQVFGIPGLGRMLVVSISNRDYPVVQAIVVILAFWVVLATTAADIINSRIDPQLRFGEGM